MTDVRTEEPWLSVVFSNTKLAKKNEICKRKGMIFV